MLQTKRNKREDEQCIYNSREQYHPQFRNLYTCISQSICIQETIIKLKLPLTCQRTNPKEP